eukprot:66993_1
MYFSSDSRIMVLVTFMVLLISKSAIGSGVHTDRETTVDPHSAGGTSSSDYKVDDCTRTALNEMLLNTGRFSPVHSKTSSEEFHSKESLYTKATVFNKFGMNSYFAQCKDRAQIPFVNGNFVNGRLFRVFCHDSERVWSVMKRIHPTPDYWSWNSGFESVKSDVIGDPLADVQCIDGITAITDGEHVTFSNIPSMFTGVDLQKVRDNGSFASMEPIKLRLSPNNGTVPNTGAVSATSLMETGEVVAPGTTIQMKFYAGP